MKFLLSIFVVLTIFKSVFSQHGYGTQHLKNFKGQNNIVKTLKSTNKDSGCGNSVQYYYNAQIVDHFAPANQQVKWTGNGQRYWMNKQFWGGPGYPIFLYIGGEGEESCYTLTGGLYMYNLAQEHKALMIDVEHRFYGESYPTSDMSTANLAYLSADQALADLARILGFIKQNLGTTTSRVISFGGSYPG